MIIRFALAALFLAISIGASALSVEIDIEYILAREQKNPGDPVIPMTKDEIASVTIYAGDAVLITATGAPDSIVVDLPVCSTSNLRGTVTDNNGLESDRSDMLSVLICRPTAPRLSGIRVPPR